MRNPRYSDVPADGRDVDDGASPYLHHVREDLLRQAKRSDQVELQRLEDRLPRLRLSPRLGEHVAGGVDEDLGMTEGLDHLWDDLVQTFEVEQIRADRVTPNLVGQLRQAFVAAGHDSHPGPSRGQGAGQALSQSGRGACHYGYSAFDREFGRAHGIRCHPDLGS